MGFLNWLALMVGTGLVVAVLLRVSHFLGAFRMLATHPAMQRHAEQCRSLAGSEHLSFEDFRFLDDGDTLLLTSYPILEFYEHGPLHSPRFGDLYLAHLSTNSTLHRLTKDDLGLPAELSAFRPHGLSISPDGRTALVVNHANEGEDRVEHFTIQHNKETGWTVKWSSATRLTPFIPRGAANAVAYISPSELYVSTWLGGEGMLPNGSSHAPSWLAEVKFKARVLYDYMLAPALPLAPWDETHVYRCVRGECTQVGPAFVSSNGLAASKDGSLVFVVDVARRELHALDRDAGTGQLSPRARTKLPHNADNVQITKDNGDGTYELSMGAFCKPARYFAKLALNRTDMHVPSALLVAKFSKTTGELTAREAFLHDGAKLHSASAGAQWRDKVLLSGPARSGGGLLVCDANPK